MRKNRLTFILLSILFLGTISVFAGNIYVNENGIVSKHFASDGSPGLTQNFTTESGVVVVKDGLVINILNESSENETSNFPSEGLVAYYKLDETSGTVIDSTGINNGTNNGATPNVAGKINTAYDFDGDNDYINIPDTDDSFDTDTITFNFWLKDGFTQTTDSSARLFSNSNTANILSSGYGVARYASTGQLDVFIGGYRYRTNSAISSSGWHMITVVFNGPTDVKIYEDASEMAKSTIITGSSYVSANSDLQIAQQPYYPANYMYGGIIDEVGIWSRALNSTEVSELYNSGDGLSYS